MKKETTEKQLDEIKYELSDTGKKHILKIISPKPFTNVISVAQLLAKEYLDENEANHIIKTLSNYSYTEVHEFFANAENYFAKINDQEKLDQKNKD